MHGNPQVADGMINALSDAVSNRETTGISVLVLVVQLVLRMSWLGVIVAMMMTTSTWRSGATDSLVFDFCGVLSINAIGLVLSMFLRVYRVMLSALPDDVRKSPRLLFQIGRAHV